MKDFYSDYYFFDENCSFELLFLIEAGRPSLRLTDEFYGKWRFWVIPVDTVRAAQKFGIVDRVTYRPSRATKILRIASGMDEGRKDMAFEIVDGKLPPEKCPYHRAAYNAEAGGPGPGSGAHAVPFFERQAGTGSLPETVSGHPFGAQHARGTHRGSLSYCDTDPAGPGAPVGTDRTGGGYRSDSWFGEFEWRAAYHDTTDLDEGYVRGAQINFMDLSLRYYFADDALRLHRLHVIDILSLAPWNSVFKPISWKVNIGADEMTLSDGNDHPILRLNAGGGLSTELGSLAWSISLPSLTCRRAPGWKTTMPLASAARLDRW